MSDIDGNYNVYLNSGNYLQSFSKDGYFTDQKMITIPTNLTDFNLGTEVMISGTLGILEISDTYVYKTPSQQQIPIPNLKVQLYPTTSVAGTSPAAVSYTDVSGTFVALVNPGMYVMSVTGEVYNTTKKVNDRYNMIYNIEVDQHFPNNFQYLDTSGYSYLS